MNCLLVLYLPEVLKLQNSFTTSLNLAAKHRMAKIGLADFSMSLNLHARFYKELGPISGKFFIIFCTAYFFDIVKTFLSGNWVQKVTLKSIH